LETLTDRNIDSSKVLMLVTENGANVVKAMRLIGEEAAVSAGEGGDFEDEHHEGGEDNSTTEEEADDDREGEVDEEVFNFPRTTFTLIPYTNIRTHSQTVALGCFQRNLFHFC